MAEMRDLIHTLRALLSDSTTDIDTKTRLGLECLDRWLAEGGELDWRPQEPGRYKGHMVYEDADLGFIIVSMAWGEGGKTPIHDHGTWGLMGVIEGAIQFTNFVQEGGSDKVREIACFEGEAGDVTRVLPPDMEIHRIENTGSGTARSIHIYGHNIGF